MDKTNKMNSLPVFQNIAESVSLRARKPKNFGPLETWNGHARITGPCGDTMEYWIFVKEDEIIELGFITDGCGSSRAAGSMAGELADGKTIQEALVIEQPDVLDALNGLPLEHEHCALLATNTMKAAVRDYVENR